MGKKDKRRNRVKRAKCEICGVWKRGLTASIFLARFPLDAERCRLWVKAAGNEDLVYIPVPNIHNNKYVCGDHFSKGAFTKMGKRLKRTAIPTLNLRNPPLSDKVLEHFPYTPVYVQEIQSIDYTELLTFNESSIKTETVNFAYPPSPALSVEVKTENFFEDIEEIEPEHIKEGHTDHTYSKAGCTSTRTEFPVASTSLRLHGDKESPQPCTREYKFDVEWEDEVVNEGQNVSNDVVDVDCQDVDDDCQVVADDYQNVDDDCQVVADDYQDVVDDDDLSFYLNLPNKTENKESAEQQNLPEKRDRLHEGFMCNNCSGVIEGFRYTCIECLDHDLCGSCEASGAHCLHYVLRIPTPRPYAEIQSVLSKIRQQLQYMLGPSATQHHSDDIITIKEEVKEEDNRDPDPLSVDAPPAPDLASHEDVHLHTDTKEYSEPVVKTRTIKMANTLLTINSRLKPSASTKIDNTWTKRKHDNDPKNPIKKINENLPTIEIAGQQKTTKIHKTLVPISLVQIKRKKDGETMDLKKSVKDSLACIDATDSTTAYNPRTKRKHQGEPAKVSPEAAKKVKVELTRIPINLLRNVRTRSAAVAAPSQRKPGATRPAGAPAPGGVWRYHDDTDGTPSTALT